MRFLASLIVCLLLAAVSCRVSADPAAVFLRARQSAGHALLTPAEAADALVRPSAYAGRQLDMPATVSGLVSAGADRTALLTPGEPAGSLSVSLPVPTGLNGAAWLESGARVRVLLAVAPDDPALPSGLRLVAVAPEGDVVAAEKHAAMAQALATQASAMRQSARSARRVRRNAPRVVYVADSNPGHPAGALSARALSIYAPYRSLVRRWNRRLSGADVDRITTSILYFSDVNNLDPRLPVAMIIAESDFDLYSTSHTGAMGLSQLMPETARGLGVTNAYDPVQNIGAAVHILRGHLDSYGGAPANAGVIPFSQIALTMAAYNAGPGAVHKYHGVPPYRETQRYIRRVASLYRQMCGTPEASAK